MDKNTERSLSILFISNFSAVTSFVFVKRPSVKYFPTLMPLNKFPSVLYIGSPLSRVCSV